MRLTIAPWLDLSKVIFIKPGPATSTLAMPLTFSSALLITTAISRGAFPSLLASVSAIEVE